MIVCEQVNCTCFNCPVGVECDKCMCSHCYFSKYNREECAELYHTDYCNKPNVSD